MGNGERGVQPTRGNPRPWRARTYFLLVPVAKLNTGVGRKQLTGGYVAGGLENVAIRKAVCDIRRLLWRLGDVRSTLIADLKAWSAF